MLTQYSTILGLVFVENSTNIAKCNPTKLGLIRVPAHDACEVGVS